MYELNINEVQEALEIAYGIGEPVFILGPSGCAKSEGVRQFSERFKDGMIDIRLVDKEPTEVAGIPIPTEIDGVMKTVWALCDYWPDADFEGLIVLEELTNASKAVQSVAYELALDHRVSGHPLPEKAMVVAIGNDVDDGGQSDPILAPLLNRFYLIKVEPNLEQWIEDYAIPNGVHPSVITFLKAHPEAFFTYKEKCEEDNSPFATARSWTRKVSKLLYSIEAKGKGINKTIKAMIAGGVGEELVAPFLAHYEAVAVLPAVNDILTGRIKTFDYQNKMNMVFASGIGCLSTLMKGASKEDLNVDKYVVSVNNFFTYFTNKENVGTNSEISVAFTQKLMKTLIDGTNKELYHAVLVGCPSLYASMKEYQELQAA